MRKTAVACLAALGLSASPALATPMVFDDPEQAAAAVVSALEAQDRAALLAVFGPENEDVIISGNDERDSEDRDAFLASYREMNRVAVDDSTGIATLYIGSEQWPFPIPLVQTDDGWSFDAEAGREEMLERRIGRNEIDVIDLMRAYVDVQSRYRQTDWDGDGVMEFAAHVLSTPGTRDGLYWPPEDGAPESPIGDAVAEAAAEGFVLDGEEQEPEPYLGYYYHILQNQGSDAPGGALDYMINGNMVAGHALIAFPSSYGDTGVMTFLVGENGVVLEADLGEQTVEVANAIESFEPDERWSEATDE